MRLSLAQIDTTVGDFDGNHEKIEDALARAEAVGTDLLLVPELATCGYPPRDLIDRPAFQRENARVLRELARRTRRTALLVGTFLPNPARAGKRFLNAAVLLRGGRVAATAVKCLLPTYDVFDEGRHFEPAPEPILVPLAGEKLGVTICEDLWNDKSFWKTRLLYDEDPGQSLVRRGATLVVNVSASPFSEGKPRLRRRMLAALARRARVPVAYANLVGGNDELVFDGASLVLDGAGRLAAHAALFDEDFLTVDVANGPRRTRAVTEVGDGARAPHARTADELERRPLEALRRALVRGVRDYARKCGFSSAVLGLSGGIDSALVAVLAVEAFGRENVRALAMPSRYSSPGSVADAKALAENLGVRLDVAPIEPLYVAAKETLAPLLSGHREDVTEENLQARVRGMLLMAVSNKLGPLVLTTGNKSELAVGYCTLYGDMCGGLAPISDLPKMRVYALARHLNESAGRALIPESTLTKAPSAELRPDQTDQDSLPPYPLLDAILENLVEKGRSAVETARALRAPLPLVREIAAKVDRAEYKRAQAAPGLRVSAKAFGMGRRVPIAQKSPA